MLIRFRLENDENVGKSHVDLFCSGDISENLVFASFVTCVGSGSCAFTTRTCLLERLVSLFRLFRTFPCQVLGGIVLVEEMI